MPGQSLLGHLRHAAHRHLSKQRVKCPSLTRTSTTPYSTLPFLSPRPKLLHIHLPCSPTTGYWPTYARAAAVQEHLTRAHLDFKASPAGTTRPPPALLTFTPEPTFTLGRRKTAADVSEAVHLRAKLDVRVNIPGDESTTFPFRPAIASALRGGQTTYHGPGQLVAWPILDLHGSAPRLPGEMRTVRGFAAALEDAAEGFLREVFGVKGLERDEDNPGIWVRMGDGAGELAKIASLGVHLRRYVSGGGGVAINIDMPVLKGGDGEERDEATNPWARFVPCGVEGRGVTCAKEVVGSSGMGLSGLGMGNWEAKWAGDFARTWAAQMGYKPDEIETMEHYRLAQLFNTIDKDLGASGTRDSLGRSGRHLRYGNKL